MYTLGLFVACFLVKQLNKQMDKIDKNVTSDSIKAHSMFASLLLFKAALNNIFILIMSQMIV